MKSVEVTVSPEGDVSIEAVGFKGQSCAKATEALEKALGMPTKKIKKPDWNVQELSSQKVGG